MKYIYEYTLNNGFSFIFQHQIQVTKQLINFQTQILLRFCSINRNVELKDKLNCAHNIWQFCKEPNLRPHVKMY